MWSRSTCARDYSCEDADMTLRLRADLRAAARGAGAHATVRRRRDAAGLRARRDGVERHRDRRRVVRRSRSDSSASAKRSRQEIYAEAGEEFNINSNPQLREILFEKLELPVLKRTPTGPSTDASVLQELAEEGHHCRRCSWSTVSSPSSRARTSTRFPGW